MSGTYCPLIKENCIEHRCKFYVHLIGSDPQTGKGIDKFDCAMAFIPVLLIEGAQQTRQAGAAIESFRNETVETAQRAVLKALGGQCVYEARHRDGEPNAAWCRTHGFDCPNAQRGRLIGEGRG